MPEPERTFEDPPGRWGSLGWSVLFFAFGIAAGLLIAFAGFGYVADSAGAVIAAFPVALAVVAFLGTLAAVFRKPILRRLFGVTQVQIELFARPLALVAERAAERDTAGATAAARDLVALALARYA
jgi:membrane protein implicated in regulation of membrane protease activity